MNQKIIYDNKYTMDLSGYGDNLVYRSNVASADPYYYISAQLDLAGKGTTNNVFYFNKDNNYEYLKNKNYSGFHKVDSNAVISEVTSFSLSNLVYSGANSTLRVSASSLLGVARNGSDVATLYLSASPSSFNLFQGDYINVSGVTNDANSFNNLVPAEVLSASNAVSRALGAEIVSVARLAGVATITLSGTPASFNLANGDLITISGITNDSNSFNGTVVIASVLGNTFTYSNAGGDILNTAALGSSKLIQTPAFITYGSVGVLVANQFATGANRKIETPLLALIGGAYAPLSGSANLELWAGPSGNLPAPLSSVELGYAQSCLYGQEPDMNANPVLGSQKYLAVKMVGGTNSNKIVSGVLSVLIKVYPKFG
jgi:hypothetical protein